MTHTVVVSDIKTEDVETERTALNDVGADVDLRHVAARTPGELVSGARGADALIVDAGTPVTAAVLDELDLEVVGRAGIGVDNVDVAAAAEQGVTVVNVPDYCVDEVSTHAVSLLLACARSVPTYDRDTHDGGYDWAVGSPLHRLRGRTLGLVAFGKIARRVAAKVDGFGLDVVAVDPYVEAHEMEHFGVETADFETVLARADLLSVHAPLYEATEDMFDADAFAAMGEGVVFVNTARGGLVDEAALRDALDDGTVAAAGLDVLAEEPPTDDLLAGREDVTVTPHVAWYSEESKTELRRKVATDVGRVLLGEAPRAPVDPDAKW